MMAPPNHTATTGASFVEFAATRDPRLRDMLVEAHLGLAHQLARRFANRGEPHEDLVQVASVALIHAVDRFDPARGFEFSTFATRTVLGELKRHFRDKGWAVRAPRRIQELYLELGAATDALTQELGHPPTVPELAERTGATEEAVLEALEAGQAYRTASIDAPDRREGTIASRLGEVDAGFAGADDHQVLVDALGEAARTRTADPADAVRRRSHPVADRRADRREPDACLTPAGGQHRPSAGVLHRAVARVGPGPDPQSAWGRRATPRKKSSTWRTTSSEPLEFGGLVTNALAWRS